MSGRKDDFFLENIVRVNKSVAFILSGTVIVPIVFLVFNVIGIWDLSKNFCIGLLAFQIVVILINCFLIKKSKHQFFLMYMELLDTIIFVSAMAYTGTIRLSISYAIPSIISCLYYNKKVTRFTTILDFILVILITWSHRFTDYNVVSGRFDSTTWFIQMLIGYVIEFTFLYFIIDRVSKRTQKTLASLTKANVEYEIKNQELAETQFNIIQFVAQCLGSHDLFTGRHVIHTQRYVEILCTQLIEQGDYVEELDEKTVQLYQTSAFLHDIGKIHIPEGILNKIGKFTPEEFEMMKSHPFEGKKLLEYLPKIENGDFNKIAKEMAYCHHEKWDGSGYPRGLKGTEIPLCARIMAAADVLDALISQRLYKDPMSLEEAMEVFRKSRGTHFEPCIADAVIACESLIGIIDQDFKNKEASTNNEELEWWQRYHNNLEKQ